MFHNSFSTASQDLVKVLEQVTMVFSRLSPVSSRSIAPLLRLSQQFRGMGWRSVIRWFISLALGCCCLLFNAVPAWAGLNDDHYDGNIFALYAGNGSLFPPRITLAESLQRDKPVLLVFFSDDSRDCKLYSSVVSELDAYYGRAANIIPVSVDAIPPQASYTPTEAGYYYGGFVPQTVLLDQSGQVVLNERGNIAFERVDDVFREVFDLLPRSESVELKRRPVNELNTELVQ